MTNISDGTINILRGISDTNVKPQERDWKYDTSIWNAASEQADKEDNKTAITVLLEDFAELTNKFKNCELLCPAGSFESMKTALHFGADAVYAGGPFMQLRSDNAGFSYDDILKAVELVHGKGKKLYITVNCFATNNEIDRLSDYARFLYQAGVDGVIVSDLGSVVTIKGTAKGSTERTYTITGFAGK